MPPRDFGITRERRLPYQLGATWDGLGANFSLFSANATKVELCLFDHTGLEVILGVIYNHTVEGNENRQSVVLQVDACRSTSPFQRHWRR
jgi:pullulanase/glycogen debranching enzyme